MHDTDLTLHRRLREQEETIDALKKQLADQKYHYEAILIFFRRIFTGLIEIIFHVDVISCKPLMQAIIQLKKQQIEILLTVCQKILVILSKSSITKLWNLVNRMSLKNMVS